MTKRLTAEEVADDIAVNKNGVAFVAKIAMQRCERLVRENLVPQYQDVPDADGWHWLENLDADAPPQLVGQANRIADHEWLTDANGNTFATRSVSPSWVRWTVSGWVPLVGRVCPIGARPHDRPV